MFTQDELQSFGYFLKLSKTMLESKKIPLTETNFNGFVANPMKYFPIIMRQLDANHLLTIPTYDRQMGEILDHFPDALGHKAEPIPLEERGVIQIAYAQYDPDQISISSAAAILGISKQAVNQAFQSKKIKGIKLSNRVWLYKRSVYAYKEKEPFHPMTQDEKDEIQGACNEIWNAIENLPEARNEDDVRVSYDYIREFAEKIIDTIDTCYPDSKVE